MCPPAVSIKSCFFLSHCSEALRTAARYSAADVMAFPVG